MCLVNGYPLSRQRCCLQIVYSFIMQPSSLPPSYIRFIMRQAGKEPHVWTAVREQALRNWRLLGLGLHVPPTAQALLLGQPLTPCEFWHPGQSCLEHTLTNVPASYARALAVYVPVYLVPALLVHRQKLASQPQLLLPKLAQGIGRSALFLTAFIALAFGSVCAGFAVTGVSSGPLIAACTAAGGLAVLLEKKSRRMELALYCLSRAAESSCRCLVEWGWLPSALLPRRLDVMLFAAGCAAIMHCYSDGAGQHRDVFRSKYLNVLDFIFGNSGDT
ncbi:TMEM135_C_rich domain-containing protein [Haematococcus lacustris]|uniref:TMEM135_C_rich domain-containing protein n=1 Tax=Haematococcus lacustris TaxID=44745 RepID=A0A699Y9Z8_HAELA|nr:TMEM135_C_rich domain-containing protein [Haematococcus lacustris]